MKLTREKVSETEKAVWILTDNEGKIRELTDEATEIAEGAYGMGVQDGIVGAIKDAAILNRLARAIRKK